MNPKKNNAETILLVIKKDTKTTILYERQTLCRYSRPGSSGHPVQTHPPLSR